jgi:hypothetical protein
LKKSKIIRWYTGKNEGHIEIPRFGSAYSFRKKYHWTAKTARSVIHFYLRHWKWILGFILAVIVAVQRWG